MSCNSIHPFRLPVFQSSVPPHPIHFTSKFYDITLTRRDSLCKYSAFLPSLFVSSYPALFMVFIAVLSTSFLSMLLFSLFFPSFTPADYNWLLVRTLRLVNDNEASM